MNRKIRNASADQRVHEAGIGGIDDITSGIAAEEVGVALRPDDPHSGDWSAVDKILLVRLPPSHDRFGCCVHAAILVIGADEVPPRLNATGDAGDHPHARFRRRLARDAIVARTGFVHRHRLGRELVPSEHHVDALAGIAILLEAGIVIAPLMIEHHDVGTRADLLQVAERARLRGHRSAVHARPDAIRSSSRARGPIVQFPYFDAARVTPHDPVAVRPVVPVGLPRQRAAGFCSELAGRSCRSSRCCRVRAPPSCCR